MKFRSFRIRTYKRQRGGVAPAHSLKNCLNSLVHVLISLNGSMRRLYRILLILLLFPPLLAAAAGWLSGPAFLHPIRRELTPDLIREADASFAVTGAYRQDFDVRAPDGVLLRGWKVVPRNPNGNWVFLFHGVADNRVGVIGQSEILLRAGYSVVMMDARAHGASEGPIATYGWLERNDTRAIIDALLSSERDKYISVQFNQVPLPGSRPSPSFHIYALGESMGAGIALQSAAADPRIEAVVAEASFASLREASYDYAGLQKYPWLGKTLFAPGAWTMIYAAARGPKQIWIVPGAFHAAALGFQADEFRRRVLGFFAAAAADSNSKRN